MNIFQSFSSFVVIDFTKFIKHDSMFNKLGNLDLIIISN